MTATDRAALAVQLENLAPTQYQEFNFASMCALGDTWIGGNEDGLYELAGDDDNGTGITAQVEFLRSDFGLENQKSILLAQVSGEGSGGLRLTFKAGENREFSVDFVLEKELQDGVKVYGTRDLVGQYWELRLENIGGAAFSVDKIDIFPSVLNY